MSRSKLEGNMGSTSNLDLEEEAHGTTIFGFLFLDSGDNNRPKIIMAADSLCTMDGAVVDKNAIKFAGKGKMQVLLSGSRRRSAETIEDIINLMLRRHRGSMPSNIVDVISAFEACMDANTGASYVVGVMDDQRPLVFSIRSHEKKNKGTSATLAFEGIENNYRARFTHPTSGNPVGVPVISLSEAQKWTEEGMAYAALNDNNTGGSFYTVFIGTMIDGTPNWSRNGVYFDRMMGRYPKEYFGYLRTEGGDQSKNK